MEKKFTILKGTPTPAELKALELAIPTPQPKKPRAISIWRRSQIRQPLPKKWGTDF
jgi:hypothetical protein